MLLDEPAIVAALGYQHVHPPEQQREIGAGRNRQPVFRLARGHREARIDDNDRDAPLDCVGEFLHLRVVHVLAQVRSDQHETIGVLDVGRLRRAEAGAERQRETDVARTSALRVRGAGEVDRAPALQHVLEEALADPVRDGGDRFRAVLRLDLLHPVGDVDESFVPGHRRPLLLATLAAADQRLLQPIRVVVRADGAGSARAEPAAALRVLRVAFELPQLAVADVRDSAAAPETHFAESGYGRDALGRRVGGVGDAGKRLPLRRCGNAGERRGGDFQKAPAGDVFHGWVVFVLTSLLLDLMARADGRSRLHSYTTPLDCAARRCNVTQVTERVALQPKFALGQIPAARQRVANCTQRLFVAARCRSLTPRKARRRGWPQIDERWPSMAFQAGESSPPSGRVPASIAGAVVSTPTFDQYVNIDKYHAPQWLGDRAPRRFHVMVKPAGSTCNLDCTYCFYLSKQTLPGGPGAGQMAEEVLERFIRDYIRSVTGDEVVFSWQGGEPTLLRPRVLPQGRGAAEEAREGRPAHRERPADQRHAAGRGLGALPEGTPVPRRPVHRRPARAPRPLPDDQARRADVRQSVLRRPRCCSGTACRSTR